MTRRTRCYLAGITAAALLLCSSPTTGNAIDAFHQVQTNQFVLLFERSAVSGVSSTTAEDAVVNAILRLVHQISNEIGTAFNTAPRDKVRIRFLSRSAFHRLSGTYPWMSAVFSQGEVSVPLHEGKELREAELLRNLKHEYVHVLVADLSKYRCPAWLDEGLAQLFEGRHSKMLEPELRRWAARGLPLSLAEIEKGFSQPQDSKVVLSYAQSLFLAKLLVERFGIKDITKFLRSVGDGADFDAAFKRSFTMSPNDFERLASGEIRAWSKTKHLSLDPVRPVPGSGSEPQAPLLRAAHAH